MTKPSEPTGGILPDSHVWLSRLLAAAVTVWSLCGSGKHATASSTDAVREQSLQLRKGWNSVYLEVDPLTRAPAQLFAGTPIEIVAAFFGQTQPAAYIRNPGDAPWREEGWGVWYAPERPDAVVTSLHALSGNQACLIHSSADFTWKVRGRVLVKTLRWQPESYNFVGFGIDPQSPPTFDTYFSPSTAHRGQRIYRLTDGVWAPVRDLATTKMNAGEAYWVYCSGGSDYQGPIRLNLPSGDQLNLGAVAKDSRIELLNASGKPAKLVIEAADNDSPLPLAYVDQDFSTLRTTYPALPNRLELPILDAGSSRFLRLSARRELMTEGRQSALLRVSNGDGVQLWLPVVGERK